MKKTMFFIFFNISSLTDCLQQKLENKKKTLTTEESIRKRITAFINTAKSPQINEKTFLNYPYINTIILNIPDFANKEYWLSELHSLRRAIYLFKINQKKSQNLNLTDTYNSFIKFNLVEKLEPLIHNYLASFFLTQESLVEDFLDKQKKDEFNEQTQIIKHVFQKNKFFPYLMDLICTQVNAFGSNCLLDKNDDNTIKVHNLKLNETVKEVNFFTSEVSKQYQNLYNSKNQIFTKNTQNEQQVHFNLIEKLNNLSRYPVFFDKEKLTEQELFEQVLAKIILSFCEEYIEELDFNKKDILETFLLMETFEKKYLEIKIKTEKEMIASTQTEQTFFCHEDQKGRPYLVSLHKNEIAETSAITQQKTKRVLTKYDYCLLGFSIVIIATLIYQYKNPNKINNL